ncbi:MAG: DUF4124 domain-containing protein, partial [Hydrocarboniphaga effusa]|nr:DUF4124 domain-containing protein [Hydrocarboniphaga effusa]
MATVFHALQRLRLRRIVSFMRALLFALLFLAAASASAEVYKWVDEKGVVHYTDQPPSQNARPAKLPPLQTYKEGTKPKLDRQASPDNGARQPVMASPALKISSPAPEETFRGDAQGQVPVSVQMTPALGDAQFLIYHLDGAD